MITVQDKITLTLSHIFLCQVLPLPFVSKTKAYPCANIPQSKRKTAYSQSYLAFPGKRGSVTLAEIPPSFKFAKREGEDGVSLDHTSAGEKGKKAQSNDVTLMAAQ